MKLNKEYHNLAKDILENEYYLTLKNDAHHGSNRYDHCKRVSYVSFIMAKMFKGNTNDVVISGLLHDFYYGKCNANDKITYLNHPRTSVNNSLKYFDLNENEINIIETHMYHYALVKNLLPFINKDDKVKAREYKPQSKEGYIVCLSDLLVSIFEVFHFKVRYTTCLYFIFLINIIRY